jgi:hypothetical protein
MKSLPLISIALSILLAGCSTSNKFASGFGKRRYTKGFFVDAPGSIKTPVESKATTAVIAKTPSVVVAHPAKEIVTQTIKPSLAHTDKRPVSISKPVITQFVKPVISSNTSSLLNALGDHGRGMHNSNDGVASTDKHSILSGLFFMATIFLNVVSDLIEIHSFILAVEVMFVVLTVAAFVLAIINAIKAVRNKESYDGIAIAVLVLSTLIVIVALTILIRFI